MGLPSSGAISLYAVNEELRRSGTTSIGMNTSLVRTLASKTGAGNTIKMSDLRGKSLAPIAGTAYLVYNKNTTSAGVDVTKTYQPPATGVITLEVSVTGEKVHVVRGQYRHVARSSYWYKNGSIVVQATSPPNTINTVWSSVISANVTAANGDQFRAYTPHYPSSKHTVRIGNNMAADIF